MFDGEVLIVGLGSIGERHVRNLLKLGQKKMSVFRRKATPPRTLKGDEYYTVRNIDEAFDRGPVAVIIATPTANHLDPLRRAIEIGASILVEVPLSHSLDGLDAIPLEAEKTGAQILMGQNLRFHPLLGALREAVQNGQIGIPHFSRAQFGEYLPACHPWADYRERYEGRSDLGGGVVLTSIHEIDHNFWIFGPIEAVTCVTRRGILGTDVEEIAMMILEHQGGVLAEVELDFVQRTYRRSFQVSGSEGTLEWELLGDRVKIFSQKDGKWKDLIEIKHYDINQTYLDELQHFKNVLNGESYPLTDWNSGVHVLMTGLAALKSSASSRRIKVTPSFDPI